MGNQNGAPDDGYKTHHIKQLEERIEQLNREVTNLNEANAKLKSYENAYQLEACRSKSISPSIYKTLNKEISRDCAQIVLNYLYTILDTLYINNKTTIEDVDLWLSNIVILDCIKDWKRKNHVLKESKVLLRNKLFFNVKDGVNSNDNSDNSDNDKSTIYINGVKINIPSQMDRNDAYIEKDYKMDDKDDYKDSILKDKKIITFDEDVTMVNVNDLGTNLKLSPMIPFKHAKIHLTNVTCIQSRDNNKIIIQLDAIKDVNQINMLRYFEANIKSKIPQCYFLVTSKHRNYNMVNFSGYISKINQYPLLNLPGKFCDITLNFEKVRYMSRGIYAIFDVDSLYII